MLDTGLAATENASASDYDPLVHDPAVGPPAYGALPAGLDQIPAIDAPISADEPRWLAETNLDPALRATAGLGAEVVRRNQETLMASAWDQAAATREANALLNRTRLALEVGRRLETQVQAVEDGRLLQFSRGAHHRLKGDGQDKTVHGQVVASALPGGLISGAFRRRLRRGTPITKAHGDLQGPRTAETTWSGKLTADFLDRPVAMLSYAAFEAPVGVVTTASSPEAAVTAEMVEVRAVLPRAFQRIDSASLVPRTRTASATAPHSLAAVPTRRALSRSTRPSASLSAGPLTLRNLDALAAIPRVTRADKAELDGLAAVVRSKLNPAAVLRLRVRSLIQPSSVLGSDDVPARLGTDPQFPMPLYELLVRIDPELLMPGVGSIPTDTIALAHIHGAFVEAFLLGANHELGQEFIWREFPADPGGTWLRTFWDSVVEDPSSDSGAFEDIARVATWEPDELGTHATRDPDQLLVLIIKGDLLHRYPNTLIYAVEAAWEQDPDSGAWERVEKPGADALHPTFVGALGNDVTFLGFQFPASVEVDEDVVGTPERSDASPGWFFVFEELPTEPAFGLDEGTADEAAELPARWEELHWYHALGTASPEPAYLDLAVLAAKSAGDVVRAYDDEGDNSWSETWGTTSAAMARITLQRPVRMLVHADQMLREAVDEDEEPTDG
jgi:hypothetical protein